jgi:hypothetical protein
MLSTKYNRAAQAVRGSLKTDARVMVTSHYEIFPPDNITGRTNQEKWVRNAVRTLLKEYQFLYGTIPIVR